MGRLVKDFIEIKDYTSLDALIERLVAVRESLPNAGEAEVKMRGDDIFGRQLSVSFFRPQTTEEAECDARYAQAHRESREKETARRHDEMGYCPIPEMGARNLRIVA